MHGEFIGPHDERWQEFLSTTVHDFYHRPEYLTFSQGYEEGRACAYLAADGDAAMLAPLLVRELGGDGVGGGYRDAASPYGYASPLFRGVAATGSASTLLRAYDEDCQGTRLVSTFWRLHPLLDVPERALVESSSVVRHGRTVWMDLTLPPDERWRQLRSAIRRDVKRGGRQGYTLAADDWTQLDAFADMYDQNMRRVGSRPWYRFGREYFHELRRRLAERFHLMLVVSPSGEPAAGGIFVETAGLVEYHLGATGDKFLGDSPAKLLFPHAGEWFAQRGGRALHLGGGVGGEDDSLFFFKSGFSPNTADFRTARMVHDSGAYQRLVAAAGLGSSSPAGGFFPAYRAPGTSRSVG